MRMLGATLLLGLSIAFAVDTATAGQATPEDAREMALRAAEFLRANEPAKAWNAFTTSPEFRDRDLYVWALDRDCKVMAHGASPGLIGKRLCGMQDIDGKPFIWEMSNVTDQAWVDYKWQDPITKQVKPKTAYAVRLGDYVIGAGAYK